MKKSKLKIVTPPQTKFVWLDELSEVENGSFLRTMPEYRTAIAPVISREMKIKFPDRRYRTDLKTEPGFLLVHRLA